MRFAPFSIARYQLYLFQLEGYEAGRYLRLLMQRGFVPPRGPLRKQLVWTPKAAGICTLSFLAAGAAAAWITVLSSRGGAATQGTAIAVFLAALWAAAFLSFIFYILGSFVLWPLEYLLRRYAYAGARRKLSSLPNVKVVGVAGSFGKTTMKQVLGAALASKYRVYVTPDSVNTPLGIARWVAGAVPRDAEVLVIEMGEHYEGDVRELCELTAPDVAVVTGINAAHGERLGSAGAAVRTIFEAVRYAKPGAFVLLNADSAPVAAHAAEYLGGRAHDWYSASGRPGFPLVATSSFDPDSLTRTVRVQRGEKIVATVLSSILPRYVAGNICAALLLSERFGVSAAAASERLSRLPAVKHRLEPIRGASNVLVIDDSYNGNPDGAREAILLLKEFSGRRKIYLTPGLVELGPETVNVHRELGRELGSVADVVILIHNSVTPYVAEGLTAAGFPKENIRWYESAPAVHADLKNVLREGDVILFQNDWGDQYT